MEKYTSMSKIKLLYNLGDLGKDAIHAIGGKAAHLGELIKHGIPIPEGFVLSTSAFERFINRSPYRDTIRAILEKEIQLTEIMTISEQLQKYLLKTDFPPDLQDPIIQRFEQLRDSAPANFQVAVRSSANVEDLSETSFAGQADTYLCIRTGEDLIDAIKHCWASLYSARALMYVQQMIKVPLNLVNMGVIVQRMVNSDVAGVMFTANVITKDKTQALINATWGFGETIADGQVEPDSVTVDKNSMRIIKTRIGTKEKMSVRNPNQCGTVLEMTPVDKCGVLCLSDLQICELVEMGKRIEALFGQRPQDIEWAFEMGKLMALQSRDITKI